MDLKQIKTFIEVAETGSLSKAADRLHLAQPALSRQIRLLEAEIDVELFTRHGRGMQLTDAGSELLEQLGGLVAKLDSTIENVRKGRSHPRGQVAIGIVPSAAPLLAVEIARRVMQDQPGISLRIVAALTGHLIDWVQRAEIDIAILPSTGFDHHLRTTAMLYEDYYLIGPADCDLRLDVPVPVSDLASLDLILTSTRHGMSSAIGIAARKAKVQLKAKIEADSADIALAMVGAGIGYSLGPISWIWKDIEKGRFRAAPLANPTLTHQLVLALPTSQPSTRATKVVADSILRAAADLVHDGTWQASLDNELLDALADRRVPPRPVREGSQV